MKSSAEEKTMGHESPVHVGAGSFSSGWYAPPHSQPYHHIWAMALEYETQETHHVQEKGPRWECLFHVSMEPSPLLQRKCPWMEIFEGKAQHFRKQNLPRKVSVCHSRTSPLAGRCKTHWCIFLCLHSLTHRSRARIHWGWETVQPNSLTFLGREQGA